MNETTKVLVLKSGERIEIKDLGKYSLKIIENNLFDNQFRLTRETDFQKYLRCSNGDNKINCPSKITMKKIGNDFKILYLKAHIKTCKEMRMKEEIAKDYYHGILSTKKFGEVERMIDIDKKDSRNFIIFEFSSGLLEIFLLKKGENIVRIIYDLDRFK